MASRIERLERLDELRRMGALTDAEYEAQKGRLIGPHPTGESSVARADLQASFENREPEHDRLTDTAISAQPVQSGSEHQENRLDEHPVSTDHQRIEDGVVSQPDQTMAEAHTDTAAPKRKVDPVDRFIDSLPSWSSLSDFGKAAVLVVALIALWLMWLALKYLGIVLGLALLIYSMKEMSASKAAALDLEGRARKKADIRTDNFKIAAGFAVVLIVLSATIDYFAFPIRKEQTQIAQAEYATLCKGGNKFDTACKGKFIIWDGSVQSVGSDYVRTKINDDLTVDIKDIDPSRQTLVEGQKVRVSGWLAQENWVYPDVSTGRVQTLETTEVAEARSRQEAAIAAVERAKQERVRDALATIRDANRSETMAGMTATLSECAPYKSDQAVYGQCLDQSATARGWMSSDDGN